MMIYDNIVDGDRDVYFDQYDALEYGIIDHIDYEFMSVDKELVKEKSKRKRNKRRKSSK